MAAELGKRRRWLVDRIEKFLRHVDIDPDAQNNADHDLQNTVSHKIPATFFPSNKRSFGHLILGENPFFLRTAIQDNDRICPRLIDRRTIARHAKIQRGINVLTFGRKPFAEKPSAASRLLQRCDTGELIRIERRCIFFGPGICRINCVKMDVVNIF